MWPASATKCAMPATPGGCRYPGLAVYRCGCAQIKAAADVGAPYIEIHTGCYADAKTDAEQAKELERIAKAATYAASLGLKVNAGHGLTYHNVKAIAALPEMHELNIGHAIIGRAVMSGLKEAVAEMKRLMLEARG
jgi:pyridoxine 5-phosphate synthase